MPTMIERVAAAEAEASEIKKRALERSRERVAAAGEEAGREVARAREEAREKLRAAAVEAEAEGAALAAEILKANSAEADAVCAAAGERLDAAVAHILERAMEA